VTAATVRILISEVIRPKLRDDLLAELTLALGEVNGPHRETDALHHHAAALGAVGVSAGWPGMLPM